MELKAMTFNLRLNVLSDEDNAWKFRFQSAAEMINQSGAFVIGTQEGLYSMIKDLESELPRYNWVGEGRRGGLEDEFCAIFFDKRKLAVLNHGTFWLSETPNEPGSIGWNARHPRICTWCDFQFISDPDCQFRVYNTHFDYISEEARIQSALLLWNKVKQSHYSRMPSLIMGDFNAESDSRTVRFLRGEMDVAGEKSHLNDAYSVRSNKMKKINSGTFHAFTGETKGGPIDYIFSTPEVTLIDSSIEQRKINNRYPSDHFPVIARVRLPISKQLE